MSSRRILLLFLAALAVRLAYQWVLLALGGANMDVDSGGYIALAGNILEGGQMAGADAPSYVEIH